jgi:hypothetical protein
MDEYSTDLAVAKPKLALDKASATSMGCPMMGFDVGYQLGVESKAIAAVVAAFWVYLLRIASKSYVDDNTKPGVITGFKLQN